MTQAMTNNSIQEFAVALNTSPSEGAGAGEGNEAKRNKKTQLLSALLSASALGVFLEGCGGGTPDPTPTPDLTPTPAPVSSVTGDGSESNPFLATDTAEIITGSGENDWVNYAGSNEGVTVDLGADTVSGGWAAGDTLSGINNLIGSDAVSGDVVDDTLTGNDNPNILRGGAGNDQLAGGAGEDSYLFGAGDGTDTVVDDGGNIVFEQGAEGNAYTGATYAFTRVDSTGEAVTLTVTNGGNTLNVIEFASDPSSDYTFSTRSGSTDTAIPDASLVVPPRVVGDGSESNPYLATAAAEIITGSSGADWVSYAGSNERVIVDLRDDPATVDEGWAEGDTLSDIDNLIGSNQGDFFYGNSGDNIFRGGGGDDWLYGNEGADTLDGGTGEDTADYLFSDEGVRVDLSLTTAQQDFETNSFGFTTNQGGDAVGDILTDIENIDGSSSADWLTGDNNNNMLYGSYGNDRLEGGGGTDTYLFETNQDTDTVVDNGGNIIFEPIGDDDYAGAIYTFTRPDASGEAVTLTVTKGSNTLNVIKFTSDPSSYTFYIGSVRSGNEIPAISLVVPPRVVGDGSESNPFLATDAAEIITGSTGANWVSYAESNGAVTIELRDDPANARARFGWATGDTLSGINNLIGSKHGDFFTGNSGDNILRGGAGGDSLYGSAGADTLDGGAGVDSVIYGSSATRVDLSRAGSQVDFDGSHGFTANQGGDAVGDTLIDIENVAASNQDDWLTGDGNDNFLNGKGGDDRLEGGGGNDHLDGRADNDHLDGGAGDDRLEGGAGEDTYVFRSGDGTDSVVDNGGNIVFDQGTGNAYVGAIYTFTRPDSSSEAVTLTVTKGTDTLNVIKFASDPSSDFTFSTRSGSTDTAIPASSLVYYPSSVVGDGSESNPYLATAAADDFTGSGENDWVSYEESTARVTVNIGSALIGSTGWARYDTLTDIQNLVGTAQADTLSGNGEANILRGGRGNDWFNGGAGADTLDGGTGEDIASYFRSDEGVRVNLTLTTAQQDFETNSFGFTANNNEAKGDILTGIENIGGSRYNDWLTGDGNDNRLWGNEGDDRIEGGAGEDTYGFYAGDGTDTLTDDSGNIVFEQGAHNAYVGAIYTFTRPDTSSEAVTLTVTKGSNTLNVIKFTSDPSSYTFYTRSGDTDTAIPASSLVVPPLQDGSEENPFLATAGADDFTGSGENDWVSYAGSNAITILSVALGDNANPATFSESWATGDTFSGINNLIGSDIFNIFNGNSNDNILRGGAGGDIFYGSKGADTLDGGAGEDTANYLFSDEGVRVNLALTTAQQDFETNNFGFARNQGGDAVGDILSSIENIRGSNEADWLTGDGNDNLIYGERGDDRLEGGAGDDELYGQTGNDNLYGGAGEDTYRFGVGGGTDTVTDDGGKIVFGGKGGQIVFDGSSYTGAIYTFTRPDASSEAVTLTVTKGSNTLNVIKFASDPSSDFTFSTRSGSTDTAIPASSLVYYPSSVVGDGSASDPYLATNSADSFTGSGIRDWVSYAGSNGGVTIDLDSTATVSGGWAAGDNLKYIDSLIGSIHADTLSGDSGVNTLRGGSGNDILKGERGADTLDGGAGVDTASYASSVLAVKVSLLVPGRRQVDFDGAEANGNEAVGDILTSIENIIGSNYDDGLIGSNGANILRGNAGNDIMLSWDGNDQLYGGAGIDYLRGGEGTDLLDGGADSDFLFGDAGADTYRFDAGDGIDLIGGNGDSDGVGNKMIFRAPSGVTYTNGNFAFFRGNIADSDGGFAFTRSSTGDDLQIVTFTGSTSDPTIRNSVRLEDYFDQGNSAYTIYRTGYGSSSDGTIVSTQPLETS